MYDYSLDVCGLHDYTPLKPVAWRFNLNGSPVVTVHAPPESEMCNWVPLVEYELAKQENEKLRAVLREYKNAEWMVTHDWGGDRQSILDKVDNILNDE